MELGHLILLGVLIALGVISVILILMAAAYFWWRHKRSQLEFVEPPDDNETSSASIKFQQLLETQQQEQLLEEQKKQQQQQQPQNQTNKINTKLNGFLNLKTPLIGIRNPHRKPRKLQKNAESRREMWAAMTRSLEMIVALFEYYSTAVAPPNTALHEEQAPNSTTNVNDHVNHIRSASSQIKSPAGSSSGGDDSRAVAALNKDKDNATNRSVSMVDMYIDNSEPSENVGQIHFSLEYNFQESTLILKVIQGKELPAKDLSGTSDPYVRVTLLPDKKHRLETKIKRRTLNPRWNETFYFEGFPIQKLQSRILHLHVFDYDRFSRDDSIGEVFLPLCQVDFTGKPSFWKALKPPLKDKLSCVPIMHAWLPILGFAQTFFSFLFCGELLCSLCYHPSNSILTLTLVKARNLKAKDINGKSDPYTKVWLQFGDKRIEKRKTPIFKCNLNPHFNESFSFNVPWEKIRECSLDVMVMDFDNIGRNELIGRILLAGKNGSGASETKHWQDMISKPRQTIVQWHRLKPE